MSDETAVDLLNSKLESVTLTCDGSTTNSPLDRILICDFGYTFPKEARPRKEKILSVAKQILTFVEWQQEQQHDDKAEIHLVDCLDNNLRTAIDARMRELWARSSSNKDYPQRVQWSDRSLKDYAKEYGHDIVYLSPDAKNILGDDSSDLADKAPPSAIVVGMIIDSKRIQHNKSLDRAQSLGINAARWPLEIVLAEISEREPLNVDCILEGMQQWYWNHNNREQQDNGSTRKASAALNDAIYQAIEHHVKRHPGRPLHEKLR